MDILYPVTIDYDYFLFLIDYWHVVEGTVSEYMYKEEFKETYDLVNIGLSRACGWILLMKTERYLISLAWQVYLSIDIFLSVFQYNCYLK